MCSVAWPSYIGGAGQLGDAFSMAVKNNIVE